MRMICAERSHRADVLRLPSACIFVRHWTNTHLNEKTITLNDRMPLMIARTHAICTFHYAFAYVETTWLFFKRPMFVAIEFAHSITSAPGYLPISDSSMTRVE